MPADEAQADGLPADPERAESTAVRFLGRIRND